MLNKESSSAFYSLRDYSFFIGAFFLFFIILILRMPSMSYQAEMYAEMASNYLYHAQYSDWLKNLTETDYGYLPFLSRILALSGKVLGIPIALIPYYYGYLGLAVIALFCASICLPQFRPFIHSDILRFLTGLAFALYRNYDLNTFLGCLYFGAIPYFLIVQQTPNYGTASRKRLLGLGLFLMLMGLSKPLYLAFLIPLFILSIWVIAKRRWKLFYLLIPALLAFIIQISVLLLTMAIDGETHEASRSPAMLFYSFWVSLLAIIGTVGSSGAFIFLIPYKTPAFVVLGAICLAFCYGIFHFYKSYKRDGISSCWTFFLALTVVASTTGICVLTISMYQVSIGEMPNPWYFFYRHWFTAVMSLFLLFVYILDNLYIKQLTKVFCLILPILIFPAFVTPKILSGQPVVDWPVIGYSNWEAFAPILESHNDRSEVFAPLNPYPWIYPWEKVRRETNGLGYVESPPSIEEVRDLLDNRSFRLSDSESYKVPLGISNVSVYYMGLVLNKDGIDPNEIIFIEAIDSQGNIVGIAHRLTPDRGVFSFFKFEHPLKNIEKIRFGHAENQKTTVEIGYNLKDSSQAPLWLWIGK